MYHLLLAISSAAPCFAITIVIFLLRKKGLTRSQSVDTKSVSFSGCSAKRGDREDTRSVHPHNNITMDTGARIARRCLWINFILAKKIADRATVAREQKRKKE